MTTTTFADVVHQSLAFSESDAADRIVLKLINTAWVQRLRDISQTANTRLVYMFSEHSRFGHCLGVAFLANELTRKLLSFNQHQVQEWRVAIAAAALLHDIGHIAPGSHTAYRTWFDNAHDVHESLAIKIIKSDLEISGILNAHSDQLVNQVCQILAESDDVPAWTWEIISGGGWNVDRGNWCIADSILAGVSYGKYNIPALTDSIVLTNDGHLALGENRLDSMMHFALSRHAMYRQVYQHRVLLAADMLNRAVALRARDLFSNSATAKDFFVDATMNEVLKISNPEQLSLGCIFEMREAWWRYHISRWSHASDPTLSDLSRRLLNRHLFKTVRVHADDDQAALRLRAQQIVEAHGLDPRYYLHEVTTSDMHESDYKHAMSVLMEDGRRKSLQEAEPLFTAMAKESKNSAKRWLVLPTECKAKLGRAR